MVLNPHARSWYPHPHKSSSPPEQAIEVENLPLPILPFQIYNPSASLLQNPTPAMISFYLPSQLLHTASAACPVAYPVYFYYQPLEESENDVMMKKKKLLDISKELKGLLGTSTVYEPPKDARACFEGFRGRKLWDRFASHQKEDFQFCKYTTVMIKNIPNKFRRNSFMEFLDKCCLEHQLEYDFLYLPMDFKTGDNLGYAFVNSTSAFSAKKMKTVFQGYKWGCYQTPHGTYTSKKISDAAWAKIQGKAALIRHFAKSFPCDTTEYLPVVISPPRDGSTFATSLTTIGDLRGCSKSFEN